MSQKKRKKKMKEPSPYPLLGRSSELKLAEESITDFDYSSDLGYDWITKEICLKLAGTRGNRLTA